MGLKGKLEKARDAVDEAREEYQEKKHHDLTQHDGETDHQFERRQKNHQHRIDNFEDLIAHLKKKAKAIKAVLKEKKADPDPDGDGLATFDGKTVAAWFIPWLEKSRDAGWTGTVTSGYRTPEYSTSLCQNMCGAPSCPGKCAGASSNHSGKVYPAGAVDVSDYTRFESIQWQIGSPLRNDLPIDPVHFSVSGH